jgi:hypothetical protein
MKISSSLERHTFGKQRYIERMNNEGKPVRDDYLDLYDSTIERHAHRFDDPESRVDNLEYDLLTAEWILNKVRASDVYAQNLYAAICNNDFVKNDVWPLLKDQRWHCSWRYAGGIVADMREQGDYIDWYCSGIQNDPEPMTEEVWNTLTQDQQQRYTDSKNYVNESVVTEEIRGDLLKLGWIVIQEE